MQTRRRWTVPFFLATLVASGSLALAVDFSSDVTTLQSANAEDAVAIRNRILEAAPKPGDVIARDRYGADVAKAFGPVAQNNKNPDAQLNAAILIAEMQTISTDSTLEKLLATAEADVRYWAAKGLATLMPRLKPVGGVGAAVTALQAARKAEKDPLVQAQIDRALTAAGVTPTTPASAPAPGH
jgi:hypothetical protein